MDDELVNNLGHNSLQLDSNLNHSCSYFENHEFINYIGKREEKFSVYSHNIRSLNNKIDDIQELLSEIESEKFSFSILLFQEIWAAKNAQTTRLENYQDIILQTREGKRGGGLGIYLKQNLSYEIIDELSYILEGEFETQFIKVFFGKNKFKIIGNIYRIPGGNLNTFIEWFGEKLTFLKTDPVLKKSDEIIFGGDFNANFLNFDSHNQTNDLLNLLISSSFLPMITLPTRICQNSATLIDNIFSNKKQEFYESGLIMSSISDHLPIFYLNVTCEKNTSNQKQYYYDMSPNNVEKFKEKLSSQNWDSVTNNNIPRTAFESFGDILEKYFKESFPLKEKCVNKGKVPINPWMSQELLKIRKAKNRAFKNKLKYRTESAENKFKCLNNKFKKLARKEKKKYYHERFEDCVSDIRKTWSLINSIVKKKKCKNDVPCVFTDEQKSYNTFSEIANGFNDFFVDVGPRLSESVPQSSKSFRDFLGDQYDEEFNFQEVNSFIINTTLSKLKSKSSVGNDNISMKLLKEIMPLIIMPIIHLFNLSLKTGYIPDNYKCAKIIPIYKAGEKDRFDNYRPISILPALSKLLEKIVAFQMIRYLEGNKMLYQHQYGFRRSRDTQQPLIHLINKVYDGLNKPQSEYSACVFLDLKKAFDTCDIPILLSKLKHYGFKGVSAKWFQNYLTNRKQYVEINGVKSEEKVLTHGVPQGSVIGPILFLLYINDLPNSTTLFCSLFADDTIFCKTSSNLDTIKKLLNEELDKASVWFRANKLSLNVSKTKFMVFRLSSMQPVNNNFRIFINGEEVERISNESETKSFKFVGVHLDEFLNWNEHTKMVKNKVSSSLYALNQIKNVLPSKTLKTIYSSMILPHLNYSNITWGLSKSKDIDQIRKQQKRAIRIIVGANYNAHTEILFGQSKILKFDDLVNINIINFTSKFFHKKLPESFDNMFKVLSSQRSKKLLISIPKTKHLEYFPAVSFPKLWNNLRNEIRLSGSVKKSLSMIKKDYFSTYKSFHCNKRKCFSCKK
jgi:exonuclease III